MNPRLTYLSNIFLLGLLFFAGGWLGFKLIVPPGYASPLWPSAGIGLAALLMGGARLWPGIWLGAYAIEPLIMHAYSGSLHGNCLLVAAIIATGASLQALFASWMIQKKLGPGVPPLDTLKQILWFFLLGGPLACLTGASVGVGGLWLGGLLPPGDIAASWLNWWIGDSMGVLLASPLAFCLFAKPGELWLPRRVSVALPMLLALLALWIVFSLAYQSEKSRIQMEFDIRAANIDRLLVEHAKNVVESAEVLRDLYSASDYVDRGEFSAFARSLLKRHPEIQSLEWSPRVTAKQLPDFERSVRGEGFPDFKVFELDTLGRPLPAAPRENYFPILYVEPMADNKKIFGLDSASQLKRKASQQQALLTGSPSSSAPIELFQHSDRKNGVLISIPAYGKPPPQLEGFLATSLLPSRMIDIALKGLLNEGLLIRLTDISESDIATLYSQNPDHPIKPVYELQTWQHEFKFCDRRWLLDISPDQKFVAEHHSALPWLTLIGGLSFTGIFSLLLLSNSGRTANIQRLVAERTVELEGIGRTLRESENQLRTLVQSQPDLVSLMDKDGLLLDINRAGLEILAADSLEQVKGSNTLELVLPKHHPVYKASIDKAFSGESDTLEFEITDLKGAHRWLESHTVPMRDSEDRIIAVLGMTRDITARKTAEEHLKLAARVFEEAHEGILITDADAIIIEVNPTFCEITGYSREEAIGKNPGFLKSGRQSQAFYRDMWQTLLHDHHWHGEVWNRRKNGDFYVELLSISALCDEQNRIIYYVGLFSDITEIKQQQQMLELMAHYDPLTRLPNRALFADRLLQAMAHSRREKLLLAVCFLDLDGFKPVNDQHGHDAGDQVLIEVGHRIKHNLREDDTVSRYGGDEFALLITGLQSVEQCTQTLNRIHQAIAEPYEVGEQTVSIGASSGISIFPLDDADADTLVRHADQAMYQAKVSGKNRYHVFDASHDRLVIDHHNQLRELETAFAKQEFCLYYQPKINLKTGEVNGVEALLRWHHPERGLLCPMTFLPVLANTELEIELGNWIIERAWQQLVEWQGMGSKIEVSVNISAYHLLWPGFVGHLESVLARFPLIESRYLQLEILESTALDDLSAVNRIIKTCSEALGIGAALDDFGTGYSSLTHMRHLPVDTVKIDRSFVRDMLDDPDDYAIVESVISLSQAFGSQVVAEGVETQEQGEALLLLNCLVAQGFAIAKPMPAEAVLPWIQQYQPFPAWQRYANAELSAEQVQIALRRLDLQQWLQRVQKCVAGPQNSMNQWPIMQAHKSHFGRWLKQAQQQEQYNKDWLLHLTALHEQLLHKGEVLMHQFWKGETQAARVGFMELETLQQTLYKCLEEQL